MVTRVSSTSGSGQLLERIGTVGNSAGVLLEEVSIMTAGQANLTASGARQRLIHADYGDLRPIRESFPYPRLISRPHRSP